VLVLDAPSTPGSGVEPPAAGTTASSSEHTDATASDTVAIESPNREHNQRISSHCPRANALRAA
jgi:hypothetical protein